MIIDVKDKLSDSVFKHNIKAELVQECVGRVCKRDVEMSIRFITYFEILPNEQIRFKHTLEDEGWTNEYKFKDYEHKFCICALKQFPVKCDTGLKVNDIKVIVFEAGVPSEDDGTYTIELVNGTLEVTRQYVTL